MKVVTGLLLNRFKSPECGRTKRPNFSSEKSFCLKRRHLDCGRWSTGTVRECSPQHPHRITTGTSTGFRRQYNPDFVPCESVQKLVGHCRKFKQNFCCKANFKYQKPAENNLTRLLFRKLAFFKSMVWFVKISYVVKFPRKFFVVLRNLGGGNSQDDSSYHEGNSREGEQTVTSSL